MFSTFCMKLRLILSMLLQLDRTDRFHQFNREPNMSPVRLYLCAESQLSCTKLVNIE